MRLVVAHAGDSDVQDDWQRQWSAVRYPEAVAESTVACVTPPKHKRDTAMAKNKPKRKHCSMM
eukprot:648026-Prorocentrum_lima.AAC.1